jgi:hypothetical protein
VNNPKKYNARMERARQKRLAKPTPTGRKFTLEHRANISKAAQRRWDKKKQDSGELHV